MVPVSLAAYAAARSLMRLRWSVRRLLEPHSL